MSGTFTDRVGHVWDVTLTLDGAERVDASDFSEIYPDQFSILEPDRKLFSDLLHKTRLLFAIIFAVVRPQIKANLGIDLDAEPAREDEAQHAFKDCLDGASINAAREAFWRTLADFFPDQKTALLLLIEEYQKGREQVEKELRAIQPTITEALTKDIQAKAGVLRKSLDTVVAQGT